MKRFLLLTFLIALSACGVDTTGISPELTRPIHPRSNPNAAVTVVEFADLQCPACRAAHLTLVAPLLEQKGQSIRYEFHHFPLSSAHRYAMVSAEAAECAADQGKFWEYVDLNYVNQDDLNPATIDAWGKELRLDMDLFSRCRKSHIKRDAIQEDYDSGKAIGVRGTPTFFVNGEQTEATIGALTKAVDDALGNAGQKL